MDSARIHGKKVQVTSCEVTIGGEQLTLPSMGYVRAPIEFEWLPHDPAHLAELDRRRAARRALRKGKRK